MGFNKDGNYVITIKNEHPKIAFLDSGEFKFETHSNHIIPRNEIKRIYDIAKSGGNPKKLFNISDKQLAEIIKEFGQW